MTTGKAIITTAIATGVGAGMAGIYYKDELRDYNNQSDWHRRKAKKAMIKGSAFTTFVGVGTGILTWRRTPAGLISRATKKLEARDSGLLTIVKSKSDFDQKFVDDVKKYYFKESLPLPKAFNNLITLDCNSKEAIALLTRAKTVIPHDLTFQNRCDKDLEQFTAQYFQNIQKAILALKEDESYLKQNKVLYLEKAAKAAEANASANNFNAAVNAANAGANIGRSIRP